MQTLKHLHSKILSKKWLIMSFSKKLGALKRMRCLPTKVLEEIYYTTTIARATYCISVWGNCFEATFNMLDDNHARAARLIHNLPQNLSNEESLARENWQPISFLCKQRLLTLMHQIYHGTAEKSIAQMLQKKDPEKQREQKTNYSLKWKDTIQGLGEIVSHTRQQWFGSLSQTKLRTQKMYTISKQD